MLVKPIRESRRSLSLPSQDTRSNSCKDGFERAQKRPYVSAGPRRSRTDVPKGDWHHEVALQAGADRYAARPLSLFLMQLSVDRLFLCGQMRPLYSLKCEEALFSNFAASDM